VLECSLGWSPEGGPAESCHWVDTVEKSLLSLIN